jgi:hypothetical protein
MKGAFEMAKTKSLSDIEEQIKALQMRKKELEEKRFHDFGKLAHKAGLLDLDIADDAMLKALEMLARTFRGEATQPAPSPEPAASMAGTAVADA